MPFAGRRDQTGKGMESDMAGRRQPRILRKKPALLAGSSARFANSQHQRIGTLWQAGRVKELITGLNDTRRNQATIDQDFDHAFLDAMKRGDLDRLADYTIEEFAAAGAGTIELLSWVALAAAIRGGKGEVIAYEPIAQWAAGIGVMAFASSLAN